jgi:Na+/melibiose symporter-like transporter
LPRLSRNRDKRTLTLRIAAFFWVVTASTYALRSLGWMPDNSSEWKMPILSAHAFVDGVLFNMLMAMMFSLLADVVEDSLLATGRREEGLILASQTFITKTSTAMGTWLAALVLTMVSFPQGAAAVDAPPETLRQLGVAYVVLMLIGAALSYFFLRRYRITRATHLSNVEALARRRTE